MRTTAVISMLAALLLCAVACSSRGDVEALRRAETILEDHPDSALALLDAIDPAALRDPDLAALHTLLHLRVRDKLGYNIGVDTGARHVIARLAHDGNPRHELLVSYYDSRFNMELHNYAGSILAAKRAYDQAAAMDSDHFWMGMAARNISDAYNATSNSTEELDYARLEYYHFAAAGCQPHLNYAIQDLARAHVSHSEYDRAIDLCRGLLDSARVSKDNYLAAQCFRTIGNAYLSQGKYSAAAEALLNIEPYYATYIDSAHIGLCYLKIGEDSQARKLSSLISQQDDMGPLWLAYEIAKKENPATALTYIERMDSLLNEVFIIRLHENFTGAIVNSYQAESAIKSAALSASRFRNVALSVILLAVIIMGYIFVRHQRYRHKQIEESHLAAARQIQEAFESEKNINHELIGSKFEIFNNLCQLVYEGGDTPATRRKISTTITTLIKGLSDDGEAMLEVSRHIDKYHADIFTRFSCDFPNLKKEDYRLFAFSILGFSGNTIALLMKVEKVSAIYDRKRRLKDRIKTSDCISKQDYLDAL